MVDQKRLQLPGSEVLPQALAAEVRANLATDAPQRPDSRVEALNNGNTLSPNELASQHEARIAVAASAQLMSDGKPSEAMAALQRAQAAIMAGSRDAPAQMSEVTEVRGVTEFGEEIELISMTPRVQNQDVVRYGIEINLPTGTPLNAKFKPCEAGEEPLYHVGSFLVKGRGILVNRIIDSRTGLPVVRPPSLPEAATEAA